MVQPMMAKIKVDSMPAIVAGTGLVPRLNLMEIVSDLLDQLLLKTFSLTKAAMTGPTIGIASSKHRALLFEDVCNQH